MCRLTAVKLHRPLAPHAPARQGRDKPPEAANPRARSNTARSIGSVNRPVDVFCWLGWYDEINFGNPTPNSCTRPCSNGNSLAFTSTPCPRTVAR